MRRCFLDSPIGTLHAVQDKLTLMIPGPTPVPESVLKAMAVSYTHLTLPTKA